MKVLGSWMLCRLRHQAGWEIKVWKQGDQTDGHHLLVHPLCVHKNFIKVFSFIAAMRSMRRKWVVHQHREEEAGAGGGCGTGPGEKEAWLQGSSEGRKAERLKINYTHSAGGGAKQHLPERQWHLSTTGMRTGSKNFLPPEWSHPSLWGSIMRALLLLREGSGLEHLTLLLPR